MSRAIIAVMLAAGFAFGANKDISTVSKNAGKYLVITKPVVVQTGDTMTVPAGREVLFANFSGITVQPGAVFLAEGTKEKPVYFTSLQDTAGKAAAFDWNGIEVKKGAHSKFHHCFISFSTSGITAEDSSGVLLDNCVFSVNGQWSFSISGIITQVRDELPFSYPEQTKEAVVSAPKDNGPVASTPGTKPVARTGNLKTRDLILGGVGVLCAAVGVGSLAISTKYRSDYNGYVPGNSSFEGATKEERQQTFNDLRSSYNASSAIGWGCAALAVIDVVFLAITIRF